MGSTEDNPIFNQLRKATRLERTLGAARKGDVQLAQGCFDSGCGEEEEWSPRCNIAPTLLCSKVRLSTSRLASISRAGLR